MSIRSLRLSGFASFLLVFCAGIPDRSQAELSDVKFTKRQCAVEVSSMGPNTYVSKVSVVAKNTGKAPMKGLNLSFGIQSARCKECRKGEEWESLMRLGTEFDLDVGEEKEIEAPVARLKAVLPEGKLPSCPQISSFLKEPPRSRR